MEMLIANKVTKNYKTGKNALKSFTLSVPAKGIFALIGRNGAGKTTLVRILATQLSLTSGSANIFGIDVTKDAARLRDIIASVPQDGNVVRWLTPRQFITSYLMWRGFTRKEANIRTEKSLKELKIEKYADVLSVHLSGGIRRKVLVCMVMATDAKIIFLDEPSTGLDPISREELWKVLIKLKKNHFIFLTTHYLEEAERLADKIGIIEDGKLMALGTMDELVKKIKYPYNIKILSDGIDRKPKLGVFIKGIDGHYQIMTTEKEAKRISKNLIDRGVKFSMNPLTLDDIFYYIVKKPIEVDNYENKEEHY
ncbi:ABC transporter ATP-binding protein [Candidatus Marsarchaeota archaeon]|jgi:ABC-2 type transport system ATP-binding protein|nr:ABC transporter ATP-binding protein [Candidatus Marsarchaeota archaeon]MCL5089600.1 ABC transporter ATP-binding protein [Candidatus Marsarchaeota archaeon]